MIRPRVPDLSTRVREAELMDSPDIERESHLSALDALERVNRVSFTAARIWSEVVRLSREESSPIRVLDVASGGGDVLHDLHRRAARHGVAVELQGCDSSSVALERARARAAGEAAFRWHQIDVTRDPLPSGCHVSCSSLFLHHLAWEDAVGLLRAMARATSRVLLVQDLLRTRLGYVFAWLGLAGLTRSDVARRDGLTSVRSAFTLEEAGALCEAAGLVDARVRRCWPQRFEIRWVRR